MDKKAYVKHDFRMSSQNHAQRKLDDKYNKDMFIYQRKYGKIEDQNESKLNINNNNNNNNNGAHVWDGRNDRLKKHIITTTTEKKIISRSIFIGENG